ncbi:MAG TPA: nicotinate (nicotinamide) nucleotide adenylyltransferase [Flavitalea sp.]|nr:nicotinate (nicotinamide) nucleotide adenylyltransferase [Flavitalea sp.]
MKIGLYFGSFNPIHHGHLIIATHIVENTDLDQVWFVVSPHNPLKHNTGLLNEYHRLHLVKLAIEGADQLRASDIEFYLPKPSFTIDTLTYIHEKFPQHFFSVIMGSDSYQNLPKWKNHQQILSNYPVFVYLRPAYQVNPDALSTVTVLNAPLLEISASHIRANLKEGKSIRYLVPDKVADEISRNRYYH